MGKQGKNTSKLPMVLYPDGRIAQNVGAHQNTLKFDMSNDSLLTLPKEYLFLRELRQIFFPHPCLRLKKIGDILKKFPTLYIRIDGHTDNGR